MSREFVAAALAQPWCTTLGERLGRAPTIAVEGITDRSGERIAVDEFASILQAAIASEGAAKLAPGTLENADLIIGGVISASRGTRDGIPVVFFAIDLRVRERTTSDVIWHFAVERSVPAP